MQTLIARQPIFLADESIAGYEILCRAALADESSGDEAAESLLVRALLDVGLGRLADGSDAFIRVTREILLSGTLETLDPAGIVILLLETDRADTPVLDACRHLLGLGYTIALDRFTQTADNEALLLCAQIIGLDISAYDADELAMQVALLRAYDVGFLAQDVRDADAHGRCLALGFRLFEGHHLGTPESVAAEDLGVARIRALRVLRLLRDSDSSDQVIEEEFRRDPALSFRLLRIVNSAAVGGQGIRSIHHAIRLLGRDALQRWLALLLVPQDSDTGVEREKLKASLTRARFCELMANVVQRPLSPGTLFLIGILSSLEAYFGMALSDVAERLDLAPEVSAALLHRRGPFGEVLAIVSAYQLGEWDDVMMRCEDAGVSAGALTAIYLDSLTWAQERIEDGAEKPVAAVG